jgi:acyl carrier protein
MVSTDIQQTVERRIYEILDTFGVESAAMRRDATFVDLEIDSLDLVEMAQIIEDEYGVQITSEDAQNLETLGDAVDLIASRMP